MSDDDDSGWRDGNRRRGKCVTESRTDGGRDNGTMVKPRRTSRLAVCSTSSNRSFVTHAKAMEKREDMCELPSIAQYVAFFQGIASASANVFSFLENQKFFHPLGAEVG